MALAFISPALAQKFPDGFFSADRLKKGEELSRAVCASCHLWPAPDILERDTWLKGPLPWMMTVMGLTPEALPSGVERELIKKSGAVLLDPPLTKDEFGTIIAFYLHSAPISLPTPDRPPVPLILKQFRPRLLSFRSSEPMALLVKVKAGSIWLGDGAMGRLELLSATGQTTNGLSLGAPPVAMDEAANGVYLACIGSFSPSEQPQGSVIYAPRDRARWGTPRTVLHRLPRPVDLRLADLNNDGRLDMVICMFGWYAGRLSWFENAGEDKYVEHVLLAKPGALRAEVRDLNGDGRMDIAVLVAQASEELVFLYNDGQGRFTEKIIFQKHPAFGYSYFEFADMDGDGRLDVVTANGDNGDYPSPPKPYHGIRICLNRGGDEFEERFFYALPGAYKAMARDFDGDGDLDLACISYYPDYKNARHEGFVYLENRGSLKFDATTFAESTAGRWLTIDAGDWDGDGDIDIVLGAVRKGPGRDAYVPADLSARWRESGLTVMLLENLQTLSSQIRQDR